MARNPAFRAIFYPNRGISRHFRAIEMARNGARSAEACLRRGTAELLREWELRSLRQAAPSLGGSKLHALRFKSLRHPTWLASLAPPRAGLCSKRISLLEPQDPPETSRFSPNCQTSMQPVLPHGFSVHTRRIVRASIQQRREEPRRFHLGCKFRSNPCGFQALCNSIPPSLIR